jgi:hypothetical protein
MQIRKDTTMNGSKSGERKKKLQNNGKNEDKTLLTLKSIRQHVENRALATFLANKKVSPQLSVFKLNQLNNPSISRLCAVSLPTLPYRNGCVLDHVLALKLMSVLPHRNGCVRDHVFLCSDQRNPMIQIKIK